MSDHITDSATGDLLEIMALGALILFDDARERVKQLGCGPLLFDSHIAGELADAVLSDRPPAIAPWDRDSAAALLDRVECFAPTDSEWAVYIVGRLIEERAAVIVPPTLHWAGDAIENGWKSLADVRAIIDHTFSLALGGAVAA